VSAEHNKQASPFPDTRWSLIASTRQGSENALGDLCQLYWLPVYSFIRRKTNNREEAEDFTQSFFARLLREDGFTRADRNKGRMRTFLLGALKRHLSDEYRKERARKRGGDAQHLPIALSPEDFDRAEHQFVSEPADSEQFPDLAYDRNWATTLLAQVHERLQSDYTEAGKRTEYEELKYAITAGENINYAQACSALDINLGAARSRVHRLREAFRAILRLQIADTVSHQDDVDEELQWLMGVFG